MPKALRTAPLCFGVVAVRTMPAATLAAIPPFQKVLGRKNPIAFGTPVVISFFQRYSLIHKRIQLSGISASKIRNGG